MSDTRYKKYTLSFKISDGTTHTVSFEVPLGKDGGYYTPKSTMVSDTKAEIAFIPSDPDMPAVDKILLDIPSGGVQFETDETLTMKDGILAVNTADEPVEDDVRPITSGAVYNEFSKAVALLKTI